MSLEMSNLVMRKWHSALYATSSIALLLTACAGASSRGANEGKTSVVVSVAPELFFVEAIGGDSVTVECLMPSGTDPETFEPGVTGIRNVASSDIYLSTGVLPFEEKLLSNIDEKVAVYNVSKGIDLIYGTHSHHSESSSDAEGLPDPHIWSSVENARIIADNVRDALTAARPSSAGYFRERHRSLTKKLDSLDRSFTKRLEPLEGQSFVVMHPSLSYFARDYKLNQLSISDDQKDSSIKGLKEAIDNAGGSGASVFFFPIEFDKGKAEAVSRSLDMSPVSINPMGKDWQKEMECVVNALEISNAAAGSL